MRSEVNSQQPRFEELSVVIEELKALCQEDVEEMISEFQGTEKNWDDVKKLLAGRQDDLEHMASKMMEFDMKEKYCNAEIGKLRKELNSENITYVNSKTLHGSRDNFDKIRKKIGDLEGNVITVESLSDELESRHVNSDVSAIKKRAEDSRDDYEKLKEAVDEKISDLDNAVKNLEDVESKAGIMVDELEKAAKKVDENRPKKMVAEELVKQAEDVKVGLVFVFIELTFIDLAVATSF